MEQKEVSFEIKRYLTKKDYINDGYPVQYFEFNNSEYYALIAVRHDCNLPILSSEPLWKKAVGLYIEFVTNDNEAKVESYPKQVSKSEALLKYLLATDSITDETVPNLVTNFEEIENGLVLLDYSLI